MCTGLTSTQCGDGFSTKTTALSDDKYEYISLSELSKQVDPPKYYFNCQIQSTETDNLADNTAMGSDNIQEQVTGFMDDEPGMEMDIGQSINILKVDKTINSDLSQFLSRPTRIHSFSWTEGTTIPFTAIDPWTLYFNNTIIRKKLDNYAFLKCNLNIKIIINASPFYYGALLFSYQPLSAFNPAPIVLSGGNELIPLSQRPHIYAYPQNSQGGSMVLPFVYYKQWVPTTATSIAELGRLEYQSFTDLLNANSVVGASCDISIYAWASEVELAGPTVVLALQSKEVDDEYSHEGTISKPASAIARATGMLSNIPIIGPFMTATSMAADTVAGIANLFGYTNVPVIDDIHYFRPTSIAHLAATDIGKPIDKLTLDSKNELSIDPTVCGCTLNDEMNIINFCKRESYYTQFDWTSIQTSGNLLWNARVNAIPNVRFATSGGELVYTTPMYMVAKNFHYWRGDIIYRFKILCSQYHKGRLEINWSPSGTSGSVVDSSNQIYTKIVDITKNTDIEFVVPYLQASAYLRMNDKLIQFGTTPVTDGDILWNGILSVKVLNKQTSPVLSADIKVLVFIKGGDNVEYAGPQDLDPLITPYAIQSTVEYDNSVESSYLAVRPTKTDRNINLIYHGESINSIRTLLNRSTYYIRNFHGTVLSGETTTIENNMCRNPLFPGYDTTGIHTAIGAVSGLTEQYNFVNWHPITWFSLCFIGNRGSVNYEINSNHTSSAYIQVSREKQSLTLSSYKSIYIEALANSDSMQSRHIVSLTGNGTSGINFTNTNLQPTVSSSLPMYSRFKMLSNNILTRTNGSTKDESNSDSINIKTTYVPTTSTITPGIDLYISAGTDYSLIFFLNTPTLFQLSVMPTAV